MFLRLLLLFTIIPLVELYVLLVLGRHVGFLPTVALVFTTGVLGAWLARTQGLSTWLKLQRELAAGRSPTDSLLDGLLILIAGAVLLTPGLLTDIAGFFLLIPFGRKVIRKQVASAFTSRARRAGKRPRVIIVDEYKSAQGPTVEIEANDKTDS